MRQFTRASRVVVFLLALASPAVAGRPIIILNPASPFVIPAAVGCGTFDVLIAPEPGRPNGGRVIQFANSAIFQGPVFVTATNLSTGKSINLNISGPGKFSSTANTFVAYGPSLFTLPANLVPPGLAPVSVANGRVVLQFDALGNLISVSFTGTARDLCQLLQ
jgi:hypothetical protein